MTPLRLLAPLALLALAPLCPADDGSIATAWNFLKKGGPTMIPLGLLSIASLAYSIERALRLRRERLAPPGLADRCRQLWASGDHAGILAACTAAPSALGKAIAVLVTYRDAPMENVSTAAADTANAELMPHVRKTKPLIVIATVSPLVGLFGTIVGMIGAFQKFQLLGESGDPGVFAHNISEALITAASGLVIAAYSLFLYHTFKNRALRLGDELEAQLNALCIEWFLGRKAGGASHAA